MAHIQLLFRRIDVVALLVGLLVGSYYRRCGLYSDGPTRDAPPKKNSNRPPVVTGAGNYLGNSWASCYF